MSGKTSPAVDEDFSFPSPRPSEVLYQNLEAMNNRLRLLMLLRMKRQLDIDSSKLRELRLPMPPVPRASATVARTLTIKSGLRDATFEDDRAATMTLHTSSLGLSHSVIHKFRLLLGSRYDPATDLATLHANRMPLFEQNRRYLEDCLTKLIEAAHHQPERYRSLPLRPSFHTKPRLLFPGAWRMRRRLGVMRVQAFKRTKQVIKSHRSRGPSQIGRKDAHSSTTA